MPPVPTTCLSSYRSAISWPTVTTVAFPCASKTEPELRPERGAERLFPHGQRLVELGVGDHERTEDADAVRVHTRFQEQQPALGRGVDHGLGELGRRLFRRAVADEL